jgi:uncharacterized protein
VTSSERFVLDTNVIVSSVLSPRSIPRQAFDLAFSIGTVLVSDSVLVEVDDVLRRPKFERYVSEEKQTSSSETFDIQNSNRLMKLKF